MNLSSIVPWGRSLDEYRALFALTDADLRGRILGCGDGPASFNAEATAMGADVVSVDPIYEHSAAEIEGRVVAAFDTVMRQTRAGADRFVWDRFADPDALGRARLAAMHRFLTDYEEGRRAGRYRVAALPRLPFAEASFDLALCSHLLFLYTGHLSLDEHVAAARELLRVAKEVRIFPLLTLSGQPSAYLAPVSAALRRDGHAVDEVRVGYEFLRGADTMLRLRRREGAAEG